MYSMYILRETRTCNLLFAASTYNYVYKHMFGPFSYIWTPAWDIMLSVASFFSSLIDDSSSPRPLRSFWKFKDPPRVIDFGWLALCGSILKMDNLRWRKIIIVNSCPLCLEEESVDHLLLTCSVAHHIWSSILGWFGYSWVIPSSIPCHFEGWKSFVGSFRGKITWKIPFLVSVWVIWKGWNPRSFEGISSSVEALIDKLKFFVASQTSILLQFRGFPLDFIFFF